MESRTEHNDNKGYNVGWFQWLMFSIFLINYFWFVVAIFVLVHGVETIHDLR